jgi:hypothetical protein
MSKSKLRWGQSTAHRDSPVVSYRAELTPQMLKYAEKFDDRGEIRWLPYLMYFHPASYTSEVCNTDRLGFRISKGGSDQASAAGRRPEGPVRLLAGSSTAFGIGATIASRLWSQHAPKTPWLNFAGRSHNSTQELLLFLLHRHLLPQIEEIVIFSGFNNLGLSRLPQSQQRDYGAFFNCGEYFEQMDQLGARHRKAPGFGRSGGRGSPVTGSEDSTVPELADQIANAAELTIRHLETWKLLTSAAGIKLSFVLQPLATWIRERPATQEKLLFDELDEISDFQGVYGDIASMDVGRRYSDTLRNGCENLGVSFFDLNPVLAEAAGADDWLFVDRIHFTDSGYDLVSRLLATHLNLA